jgi:DNA-binding transcriptional LysR family regulator
MQLEALKIFCDVVRWQSFSRGAAENGVSQSSASQAVHNLEDRLGVKLIDRSKRPLVLTGHGRVYYEGCKEVVGRYYEIEARVMNLNEAPRVEGTVRLAAIYSVGLHALTEHIERFRAEYPEADVRLECLHPTRVVESVRGESAEIGIVSYPRKWSDLTVVAWRDEPMIVAVPPGHALADRGEISPSALEGERFIHFDVDLAIRRGIDKWLKRNGVQVKTALEFDNIENIKRAVEARAGVAILPEPTVGREVLTGSLVAVRLRDPKLTRPLAIIHRTSRALSTAAERFVEGLVASEAGSRPLAAGNGAAVPAGISS